MSWSGFSKGTSSIGSRSCREGLRGNCRIAELQDCRKGGQSFLQSFLQSCHPVILQFVMFSSRIQSDLTGNRLAHALDRARADRRPFIDFTESNPTRAGFAYPQDALKALADPRGLLYAPEPFGALEARRAVASEFARRGLTVAPERIVLTASTSEAYSLVFKLLCDPGDEVLVPRPSYPLFEHLSRLDAVAAVPYDLEYDLSWTIDLASAERACSPRTRAILMVSPNNPTGSFVTPQ